MSGTYMSALGKNLEAFWITDFSLGSKVGCRLVLLFIPILNITAFGIFCLGRFGLCKCVRVCKF